MCPDYICNHSGFVKSVNAVMTALRSDSDGLQVNQMVVQLNIPINKLLPLLFEMEMKGLVKAVAGGRYRVMVL